MAATSSAVNVITSKLKFAPAPDREVNWRPTSLKKFRADTLLLFFLSHKRLQTKIHGLKNDTILACYI